MNRKWLIIIVLLALVLGGAFYRFAIFETARDRITAILGKTDRILVKGDTERLNARELMRHYYEKFGYNENWATGIPQQHNYRQMLLDMLGHADSLGLNPADYHADFIARYDSMAQMPGFDFSKFQTESEVIFTDAAISFLFHVAYGREIKTEFKGVEYSIDTARVTNAYNTIVNGANWRAVLDTLEPRINQYLTLKHRLNDMKAFVATFPELDTLPASDKPGGQLIAATKMRFYGVIADSAAADSTGSYMRTAVLAFQRMMGLDTTGKLDKRTCAFLNEPMGKRIAQVRESLNYWRWTGRIGEPEFILVNLPAARLQVVSRDSAKDLSMRVIVGKTETPTPSFTAYISKVIAYPYWNVPFSIATKEMLPKIKKDIGYLDANNLQVLNNKGQVIDSRSVNWGSLSTKKFPYRIRQSTGCDNALGVLKFDLNSPFSIYLHDTNRRDLFGRKERFMSHGCIRIEKPMELANYILANGLDSATTAKLNQCLKDEKPTEFKLKQNFPVLILYMTADVDAQGTLKFYGDVYKLEEDLDA